MIRRDRWKYIHCEDDPPLLFDLEGDPDELVNLAGTPEVSAIEADLASEICRWWDPAALKDRVIESQERRKFLNAALSVGRHTPWDWQPVRDASREYLRGDSDMQAIYTST